MWKPEPSSGQLQGIEQLMGLTASGGPLQLLSVADTVLPPQGLLVAEISLDCSGTEHAPGGIRLRARERFRINIPRGFPFEHPEVEVPHLRWAGTPHVQFGHVLCLYAAPSVEWDPSEGIRGLLERLIAWLKQAALGELDGNDLPLHPPVAYVTASGSIVVRPNIGDLAPRPAVGSTSHQHRLLVAACERDGERLDVHSWTDPAEWRDRFVAGFLGLVSPNHQLVGVPTVLTDAAIAFEYPRTVSELVRGLGTVGVDRTELLMALLEVASINYFLGEQRIGSGPGGRLYVLIGSPSRLVDDGVLRQHLVCWRADELGDWVATEMSELEAARSGERGAKRMEQLQEWLRSAEAHWVRVLEARPEVTTSRDHGSTASRLRGRSVLVLGAGALGAPIAEYCVRAHARQITIVDNGQVTPGILVRQPYSDSDLGRYKAIVLADRLRGIYLDVEVIPQIGSVQAQLLTEHVVPPAVDLVIDATADASVASLLELRRSEHRAAWPATLSLIIGHDAGRGLVTVSPKGVAGAGHDILRRLTLACRGSHADHLQDVAADLFPTEPRTGVFQPEPGCSSPTFVGSSLDVTALAAQLLDAGLAALGDIGNSRTEMAGAVVRLGRASDDGVGHPPVETLEWPDDLVLADRVHRYEVRIAQAALAEIRAECHRGRRVRTSRVETGGLLIGHVDDACRCIWVDAATGPPPDSRLSPFHFDHGIEGVAELVEHHRERSGRVSVYLGMWHSHPFGAASPSPTDGASRHNLVSESVGGPPRALLLIVGGIDDRWRAWLDDKHAPDIYAELIVRGAIGQAKALPPTPPEHDREAHPGGWKVAHAPRRRRRRFDWFNRRPRPRS